MADVNLPEEALDGYQDFEPAITGEQVESLEESANSPTRGQQRRLALLACASSSDKLRKLRDEEPEAFLDMFNTIDAFLGHAKGIAEIAQAAHARMILAGTKEVEA